MVANVAVVTEIEKLSARIEQKEGTLAELVAKTEPLEQKAERHRGEDEQASAELATQRRHLDELAKSGPGKGQDAAGTLVGYHDALVRAEKAGAERGRAEKALDRHRDRVCNLEKDSEASKNKRARLEPRRMIRELDVEQDRILTATKLTALQLIEFVVREYLLGFLMTPETFVSRVFSIAGRREVTAELEQIVFYENPRDPKVNAELADACIRLNARNLKRNGRLLRYAMA